jgi:ribosomal protein L40E
MEDTKMICSKCQFENREEAAFCRKCGSSLESEISCPKCEASNPPDSRFCEKCGQVLKPPKEAPSIDYSQPHSYTPKFLAEKILTTRSSIEGERKLVTVLFADVANYTAMSEQLDPEEVHQIMDGCFKILMDEIHKFEGTINQFTGDGVMALFGAPVAHEDHAQRACRAALAVQKAIGKSRLLLELKNILPKGEYTYLEGQCLQYGGNMLYLPILDILKSFLGIEEGDREFIIKQKLQETLLQLDEQFKIHLPAFQDLLSLKIDDEKYP